MVELSRTSYVNDAWIIYTEKTTLLLRVEMLKTRFSSTSSLIACPYRLFYFHTPLCVTACTPLNFVSCFFLCLGFCSCSTLCVCVLFWEKCLDHLVIFWREIFISFSGKILRMNVMFAYVLTRDNFYFSDQIMSRNWWEKNILKEEFAWKIK